MPAMMRMREDLPDLANIAMATTTRGMMNVDLTNEGHGQHACDQLEHDHNQRQMYVATTLTLTLTLTLTIP